MAAERPPAHRARVARAGDRGPRRARRADRRAPPALGAASGRAAWPKLAAVGIALALWQLVVWTRLAPALRPARAADACSRELGELLADREVLARRRAPRCGARPPASLLAIVIGTRARRRRVAQPYPARSAFGSFITGLQTHAVDRLVPARDPAVQALRGRDPLRRRARRRAVDRERPHQRHRPHPAAAAARRAACSAPAGSRVYRHVILPAALPATSAGLKQGWAFSWRSLMAGELLVIIETRPSLGTQLQFARELSDAPGLIAMMIVVLIIGILVDSLVFGRSSVGSAAGAGCWRSAGSRAFRQERDSRRKNQTRPPGA